MCCFQYLFTTDVRVAAYFVYYKYITRDEENVSKYDYVYYAKNYWYKMREVKQINIKNWTYYFYNDIIDLKNFDARLLKIDKKSFKGIGIYNIGYITIKKFDDCESIIGLNPLYLHIDHENRYIEEEVLINTSLLTLQMKIKSY